MINCLPLHALPGLRLAVLAFAAAVPLCGAALAQGSPVPASISTAAASAALPANGTLLSGALRNEVQRIAQEAALALWGSAARAPRIEVQVGQLPAHLKLAPCAQVVPYLPSGVRPLGRSRIGLRCAQGDARWNVSLPVTVRLWATSLVATGSLPAGTVLEARHMASAEVDLAERADLAIASQAAAIGRTLQRGLAAGDALRQADLRARQLFNTGDMVRIVGNGPGFAVSSEGQAMGPGLEGQAARVRTDSGRIITGIATSERRVELAL